MRVFILMLFTLGVLTVYGQEKSVPYKVELDAVEMKLKSGDFVGAIASMDKITERYPDAADVYYAKGLLYGQMGDYNSAIINARIAYDKNTNLQNLNFLMDLYKARQQWDDLVSVLKDFRIKMPRVTVVSRELMAVLGGLKRYDEALKIYQEEVKLHGRSDTLDVSKADLLIHKGDLVKAESLLKEWDGKSNLRQVYASLGYVYNNQKNVKQAIEVLEKGLKISKDPLLNLDLAEVYLKDKKTKQSYDALVVAFNSDKIDFMNKHRVMLGLIDQGFREFSMDQIQNLANLLVLNHPRIAESHVIKGNVLWRRGNTQEAKSLFLTAVGINPNHQDAWRMLINADMALKQVDESIKHGKEALMANPNSAMLMYFTGLAYMMKEDHENSRKMLELALDHSEDENIYLRSVIYGTLGDLYHQLKMDAASDVAYEEAIFLDSTNVTVLNNYAYYLSIRKKDLDKAEVYSKRSNELEPNSATFQDTYAWVLFQRGRYKEALTWIEKAIRGAGTSSVLFEHYGDILMMVGREKDAVKQWEKALLSAKETGADIEKIRAKIKERKYVE